MPSFSSFSLLQIDRLHYSDFVSVAASFSRSKILGGKLDSMKQKLEIDKLIEQLLTARKKFDKSQAFIKEVSLFHAY